MLTLFKNIRRFKGSAASCQGSFSPIGLDIGSAAIKLVQLEKVSGRLDYFCRAAAPAPPAFFQNGALDVTTLSEALLELYKQSGCRFKKACLSLPGQVMSYRRLTLPLLSPPETSKVIRWEAKKHLPLPVEQYVLDYAFLEKKVLQGKTVQELILVAAPKALAQCCIDAAVRAGFSPEAIDAPPFALQRLVHWYGRSFPDPYRDTVLVVNVGAESSDLLVLEQGHFRFYRSVNLGANHFQREAALPRPETAKKEDRQPWPPEPIARLTAAATALKLVRQAARTLEYYAQENDYRESRCAAIMLCGGGAMIPDLANCFATELGLQVICFDPLPHIKDEAGKINGAETGPLYAAALGMALRGWI